METITDKFVNTQCGCLYSLIMIVNDRISN